MAEYIVQKPVDFTKLTAKAKKSLPELFDITPKYDGCCVAICFDGIGRFVGSFSATGEPVLSMHHVGVWLQARTRAGVLNNRALVGEAWHETLTFPEINGRFRRQSTQPELRFAPFDCVGWVPGDEYPTLGDTRPYSERVNDLLELPYGESVIAMVHCLGDLEAAERKAREWKAGGNFDGAIVRDMNAPYVPGRSKAEVIKVKPLLELDLTVTGWNVERGEKTGRNVYTVEVEYRGVKTWVGSGVPHDFVPAYMIGQIVAVEAMGLTPDGKLREPRFKGVRHDKLGPDE